MSGRNSANPPICGFETSFSNKRRIGLLSGGISLALTRVFARGRHTYTHALMASVINSSYHGNSNSAGPKYGCFRSSSWATYHSTQKMNKEFQDFHSQLCLTLSENCSCMCPSFQYDDICAVYSYLTSYEVNLPYCKCMCSWYDSRLGTDQKACGFWQWDNETPQFINLIEAQFSYLSQVPSFQIHLVLLISSPSYQHQYSFGLFSRCQMREVWKLSMQWGNWNLLLSGIFSDDLVSQEHDWKNPSIPCMLVEHLGK